MSSIKMEAQSLPTYIRSRPKYHRRKKTHIFCGIKGILMQLIMILRDRPMKVKAISSQIAASFNRQSQKEEFSAKTVQKRVYDACLVLRALDMIGIRQKQVYFTKRGINELHVTHMEKYRQKIEEVCKSIKQKKKIIYKLREAQNVLRIQRLRNQQRMECQMEDQKDRRISTYNIIAAIVNTTSIRINDSLKFDTIDKVAIINPEQVLSGVDLLLRLL